MEKQGVDDEQEWKELHLTRERINNMAEEKLLIVAKLYNLTQRFVQELEISTEEMDKQLNDPRVVRDGRNSLTSFDELHGAMQTFSVS